MQIYNLHQDNSEVAAPVCLTVRTCDRMPATENVTCKTMLPCRLHMLIIL